MSYEAIIMRAIRDALGYLVKDRDYGLDGLQVYERDLKFVMTTSGGTRYAVALTRLDSQPAAE